MFKAILRLTKQSFIYGMGQVLSKAIVVILLPVHTNKLTTNEYGVFNILLLFMGLLAIVYSFGLNTAFLQFYMIEPDKKNKNKYFSTAFLATVVIVFLLSFIIYSFKSPVTKLLFNDDQYKNLMNLVVGILIFDAFILLSKNIMRAEEKAMQYAMVSLVNVAINCVLNIKYVVYDNMGVKGILLANLLASGLTFLLLVPITVKHLWASISMEMLKKMLRFGLPFLPSELSIFLIDSVDRKLIEQFLGLEAAGIYGAGYKVSLVIKLFINAFAVAWVPFFLSVSNDKSAKDIFSKVLTYFSIICSLVFLFFSMFMNQIVRLKLFGYTVVGQEYWGSLQIVPVVILAYICYGFYVNFQVSFFLKQKTKYFAYINIAGAVTNIVSNIFLIPTLKLMGAAYATLLAYLLMAVLLYIITQRIYPIQYELKKLFKITLISLLIFLIYSFVSIPYQLLFKLSLIFIYLLSIYFFKIFDAKEIQTLKNLLNRFYGKIDVR
jgi:O-antigen/teichoic acid export membrane protein